MIREDIHFSKEKKYRSLLIKQFWCKGKKEIFAELENSLFLEKVYFTFTPKSRWSCFDRRWYVKRFSGNLAKFREQFQVEMLIFADMNFAKLSEKLKKIYNLQSKQYPVEPYFIMVFNAIYGCCTWPTSTITHLPHLLSINSVHQTLISHNSMLLALYNLKTCWLIFKGYFVCKEFYGRMTRGAKYENFRRYF